MPRNVELDHDETMTPHVRSITLVRHGRTAYNAQHRLQGQIDIPLDEVGMWQVRQTASALRELYVDRHPEAACQLVVCSDLKRAAATAHAFADPLGLDVHPDVRVRERSFGDWEGIAVEELAKRFPEDYLSWAQFRGGELKYGAEPKQNVGRRGVEALAMSIASVMANGSVTSNATMSVAFMRSAAAAAMRMASMESCNAGMFSAPIRASSPLLRVACFRNRPWSRTGRRGGPRSRLRW